MSEDMMHKLARRMNIVVRGIDGIAGLSEYEDACDLARAAECLRQMMWARQHCVETEDPFCVAPPEWKP